MIMSFRKSKNDLFVYIFILAHCSVVFFLVKASDQPKELQIRKIKKIIYAINKKQSH